MATGDLLLFQGSEMMRNLKVIVFFLFFWVEWALAFPVLVTTDWVAAHLDDKNIVLVDMAGDPNQYRRFHLPGAYYLPYGALVEKGRDGVARSITEERLFRLLGNLGITESTHVLIYDDMGGLEASRLFWELERVGHPQVSVIDGGLVRWILDGRPVVAEIPRVQPVVYRPSAGVSRRDNGIDLATVKSAIGIPSVTFLDVRTPEEYQGDQRDKRSGHIPGAQLWPWDQAVDFAGGFVLKSREDLLASLGQSGIEQKELDLVLYCRSGHRAAQTYLTLRHLGFERLRLYEGSMAEYAKSPDVELRHGATP